MPITSGAAELDEVGSLVARALTNCGSGVVAELLERSAPDGVVAV